MERMMKISGTDLEIVANHLVESGAYSDKDPPVLLTSGESLTPYFLNTEKLCRDSNIGEVLDKHGDNSSEIIKHACELFHDNKSFQEDINIIFRLVYDLIPSGRGRFFISGGQRRDWIFSGPVAYLLGVPHISLYKQELNKPDKVEIFYPDGLITPLTGTEFQEFYPDAIHLADLLTKGSSVYTLDKEKESGWVPMLRNKGIKISNLVTVVTRLQGGEELLQGLKDPVYTHAFVRIDEEFLRTHSKQPQRVLEYIGDEVEWTQNYLIQNGIDVLVPYFDPNGSKLARAKKFLKNYSDFLRETNLTPKLETAVQEKYNKSLKEIVGGN